MLTVYAVRPCPRPCRCPSVRASVAPFCRLSVWFPLAARCHYQSLWQFQQQVQFPPSPTYCCSPHFPVILPCPSTVPIPFNWFQFSCYAETHRMTLHTLRRDCQ